MQMSSISEVVGQQKAEELCRAIGGQKIYVSESGRYADKIKSALGDHAQDFFFYFSQCQLDVPMPARFDLKRRDEKIKRLASEGMTRNELAQMFGMTARNVRRIVNGRNKS